MLPKEKMIYGFHAVVEAINSEKEIEKIFLSKNLSGNNLREIIKLTREKNLPYQFVPIERLNKITTKNHQGVIAYLSSIEYQSIEQIVPMIFEKGENPFFIILDHITDVRNFGAIVRTAECAGVHAIIIPDKGSAQINADAFKSSAGALHNIPICRVSNLVQSIKYLLNCGIKIFSTTEKASKLYYQEDYSIPLAIILGSEDKGISDDIKKLSNELIKIPMFGKISSLNVSVAADIILYEVVKQRSNKL